MAKGLGIHTLVKGAETEEQIANIILASINN